MITPLLQHMGFNELNQDPSTALANWNQVEIRLYRHSEEASCLFGICYPLNLALANSSTPPPAKVIRALIECYPQALTLEDFGGACRSRHTSGEVLKVLMDAYPFEQRTNLVKRWDLDWIACNDNKDAARMLIHNCSAAKPSNFKEWREMRPSSHTFWFKLLMEEKSNVVSFQNIKNERLLQFFILHGNLEIVTLILDRYPTLIAEKSHRSNYSAQYPIHTALASSKDNRPWHNRSQIVELLLQRGIRHNIEACGGLYLHDSSCSALSHILNSALNCPFDDPERNKCLQICLRYAYMEAFKKKPHEVDIDIPILHASIGIVRTATFDKLLEKYGSCTFQKDKKGRTALFHYISVITERPEEGYVATNQILKEQKEIQEMEFGDARQLEAVARAARRDADNNRNFDRPDLELLSQNLWDRERDLMSNEEFENRRILYNEERPNSLRRLVEYLEAIRNENEAEAQPQNENQVQANVENEAPIAEENQDIAEPADVVANNDAVEPANQDPAVEEGGALARPQNININLNERAAHARRMFMRQRLARAALEDDLMLEDAVDNAFMREDARHENGRDLDQRRIPALRQIQRLRRLRLHARDRLNLLHDGDLDDFINVMQEPNGNHFRINHEMSTRVRAFIRERSVELDKLAEESVEKSYFEYIRNKLLSKEPQQTGELLSCADVPDHSGRYPLHEAAERGTSAKQGFFEILNANAEVVSEPCGACGLYPFALFLSRRRLSNKIEEDSLTTAYSLLLEYPSVLEFCL
jgi:ankyrin repeat protein